MLSRGRPSAIPAQHFPATTRGQFQLSSRIGELLRLGIAKCTAESLRPNAKGKDILKRHSELVRRWPAPAGGRVIFKIHTSVLSQK